MSPSSLSLRHVELMEHALGASKFYEQKGFYRNYFATYEDGCDYPAWREMCEIGLAKQGRSMPQASGDMLYFHVTEAGEAIVREKVVADRHRKDREYKKISRSKRRYMAFRSLDFLSCSYGDWLKDPSWNEYRRENGIS